MSYSFTVRADSKAEVVTKVAAELDNVVMSQSVHSLDSVQAFNAAKAFIDILPEPTEGKEIVVSVHGSVSYSDYANMNGSTYGASVGVSAHVMLKVVPVIP